MKKIPLFLILMILLSSYALGFVTQDKYRWRNDDGNETAATWKASENTPVTHRGEDNIRLRFQWYTNNTFTDQSYTLWYATDPSGTWTQITNDASTNHFVFSLSDNFSDLDATTRQLSENASYTFTSGQMIESTVSTNYSINENHYTEYEVCIKPTANAQSRIYYFKQDVEAFSETNTYAVLYINNIIFVDADAIGNNDGSTWTDAYLSLQDALDAASSGKEIWVAAGTYKPSVEPDGTTDEPRKFTFQMIEGVEIYGGFHGDEDHTTFDKDDRDFETDETILSGDIGTADDNFDNCYHIFYHPSTLSPALTNDAVLDGFTITDGNANGSDPYSQGGFMYNHENSPEIRNCIIDNHYTSGELGTLGGGAMINFTSSPNIINTIFSNNTSAAYGGAIYNSNTSSPTLINVLIVNNFAGSSGGGIYSTMSSTPTLTNVTIIGNTALGYGGGIMNYQASTSTTINNSIIWDNSASIDGNQIAVVGGTITANYSCYSDGTDDIFGIPSFNNCIIEGPQLANPSSGDYRLTVSSPCIDEGNDSYNSETYDIRGKDFGRKLLGTDHTQSGTIDMGAYEFKEGTDPALLVTTNTTSAITPTSATGNGEITNTGGENADERGFLLWAYDDADKEVGGTGVTEYSSTGTFGTGVFDNGITFLSPNTHYNIRAYATNPSGTAYGTRDDFWTPAATPSASTVDNPDLHTLDVTINENGNPSTVDYAIYETSTSQFVQASGALGASEVWQDAATWGTVTVTGLDIGTEYTFQVKARNDNTPAVETSFGESASGSTIGLPLLNTENITIFGDSKAKSGGEITETYGYEVTQKGVCWNTAGSPTISDNYTNDGDGENSYQSIMNGLEVNQQYYVRAYATNENGTGYGDEKTFIYTAIPTLPEWGLIIFGGLIAVLAVRKMLA